MCCGVHTVAHYDTGDGIASMLSIQRASGAYPALIADAGHSCVQAAVYPRVRSLVWPLPRLDIPVHCLYGTGTATDEGYVYDVDCFSASVPSPPKEASKGEGDGTVNLRSLEAGAGCARSLMPGVSGLPRPCCAPHAPTMMTRKASLRMAWCICTSENLSPGQASP